MEVRHTKGCLVTQLGPSDGRSEPRPKIVVYTRLQNCVHSVLCNPTYTRDFY